MASTSSTAPESLLKVAWKSRWIILACLVLALAAGFIYISTATPMYESTSRLYLDYAGISVNQSYESGQRPQTDTYLNTQAKLLTSRPILGVVLEQPDVLGMQTLADAEIPLAFLQRNVRVGVGRKDDIISVSLASPYPVEAAQLVIYIVDAYMASRSEHEQRNSARVLEMLQLEMARATAELDAKGNELEDFQANGMPLSLGSDQGGSVMPRHLELQAALTRAEEAAMEAASFLEGVESLANDAEALREYMHAKGHPSAYVGPSTERTPLRIRLREAQFELEDLEKDFTPSNPRVLSLQADIRRIEDELSELDNQFVSAARAAAEQLYAEATAYATDVNDLCEEQRQQVAAYHRELLKYHRLDSEVTQLTTYCQTVEQQIREIRTIVGEDVGQLRMQVLEPALPAEEPASPRRGRVMAVALILGLFLGGGLGLLRDMFDQTVRSADEISGPLGLSVLGVVPKMPRRQKAQMRGRQVALQPDSHEAEAFRNIRTAIFFGAPEDATKTILVTSPAAGDGKSTVASNLAIAMAQAGQKTVILDADLRKPVQHAVFEMNHHACGLNGVLAETTTLQDAVQSTHVDGLSLLPCGRIVPNPAEILNSPSFAELLQQLTRMYDRVIVDAPPVTLVTDAQILGALCDVAVLVLRADKSTRRITQRAVEALGRVGTRLLGVVVNDVPRSGTHYGYYGQSDKTNRNGKGPTKVHPAPAARSASNGTRPAVSLGAGGGR